ncbi:TolC family outer membrane protein [Thiomicrorhabdus sediminis]|uniref:TolC family outer membrane protein n=1 Tax=Thiomicrorhabdus sediminis TaxID=2580412 RepID=A0A4P9K5X0_9GAMM|nr:TolC family outer membrane protein [Thiomicrorhabdus sediminis]QCU90211.1 TolC family outer membrane protein [Thiomicrorhabdus sediminis]
MKKLKAFPVAFIGLFASASAQALPLGLTDVYQQALQHAPSLAQAQAQYQADAENVNLAESVLLPQVKASGSYAVNDSSIDSQDVTSQSLSLTIDQALYGQSSWALYDQAQLIEKAASIALQQAHQDLILNVAKAYFDVLLAEQNLALSASDLEAKTLQFETAQASAELGLMSRVDVLEARSSLDLAKSAIIQAQNALENTQEALSQISGIDLSQLQAQGLKELTQIGKGIDLNYADKQLEALAGSANLSVNSAQIQYQIAQKEIDVKKAGHYPTVDLKATFSDNQYSDYQAGSSFMDSRSNSIALNLNVPLYSGGGTSSQVRSASQKAIAAQQGLRNARQQAVLQAKTQWRNWQQGLKLIAALREAVKSNDAFVESAKEGYKVGLKSMLEVLTATANQTSARKNLIEAIHNQSLAHLQLEAAIGDLDLQDLQQYEALLQE